MLAHKSIHTMTQSSAKRVIAPTNPESEWASLGGDHIWLPYTQMKTVATPLIAQRTMGSLITLKDGRTLVDGIASWWTACHGYNHPHILTALEHQLSEMPHIMFGGLNHEPALRLAARLAAIAPGDLARVFFSDSGSVAVEVALKMAVQFWLNHGETGRTKFVSFRSGYHGDTMACMALCDPEEGMHTRFKGYLPEQIIADLPRDDASSDALEKLFEVRHGEIAAVVVEPLVQGAGGMKFHDAATLQRLARICSEQGVLLIADEIFTGFGRTGKMFACDEAGIVPDIMCLGKALTGGALTLGATIARSHIFEAFFSDDPMAALMHGPTYMANPLACAAANASLDLFEDGEILQQVNAIEAALTDGLEPCRTTAGVVDVRVKGAIGVVQLQGPMDVAGLKSAFLEKNVWVRPFGDIVYLTPAFTISADQLSTLTQAVCEVIGGLRARVP
jgi:adenosylmethionine-8-amino-7-oxononanoate aminotransferase